jgi:hypothetical protein
MVLVWCLHCHWSQLGKGGAFERWLARSRQPESWLVPVFAMRVSVKQAEAVQVLRLRRAARCARHPRRFLCVWSAIAACLIRSLYAR